MDRAVSRQRGPFNFTASSTFSKNLGLKGGDTNGYRANASEYVFDPREYNYGVLGTDRTHVASLSWSTTATGGPINTAITGSPDVYAMPVLTCDPRDDVPDGGRLPHADGYVGRRQGS